MGEKLFDRHVVTAIKITASSQAVLALWQAFTGTGIVLRSSIAGVGTFHGPYQMTAFLTLAMAAVAWSARLRPLRSWDYAVIGLSSAAIATAFGRTGVLAVLVVAGTYGVGWLRTRSVELAWISGFSVLPMVFVGAILRTGWSERVGQPLNNLDSGRLELMRQAILVIREHPVFGVGPGKYGPAIADLASDVMNHRMVHAVPLLVAAEFGIVVGVGYLLWLVALGVRSIRVSIHSIALLGAVVPYLVLDNQHYTYPMGVTMVGLWLATLDSDRFMRARGNDGPETALAETPGPEQVRHS
jgi:O-antigen ligase